MLLKLFNFICSDKKDRYRWIAPSGGPRENVRNLAGRQERGGERNTGLRCMGGEFSSNYFLKIVSIAEFCTPTLLISQLDPIFVQSLAWLVQFRTSILKSWKGIMEPVWWCETTREEMCTSICFMFYNILSFPLNNRRFNVWVNKVQFRWFQTGSKEIEAHRGQIKL